ncbi:MAG: sulfotransferase family protein [Oscillatoria sp. PMC 1068.18]|nr:sulfotransferase family protein [Oscillatoria sp. PMC 1076.18]MEC4989846.1 sulfotransferase family protein [Oscillatoria sp. PMC 1068.18]
MKNQTKVIALWAAPRCVSTAFEKTFSQRSDTEIIHEPFCDVYYFSKWRRSDRFGDCEELENYSEDEAIKKIYSLKKSLVFIKDHAFQVLPYVKQDFFSSLTNTFIIREPSEVLASWYKAETYPSEEEFGFTDLERMWQIIVKELGQKPILVDANRFRRHPETILQRYCENIGVEFEPQMLHWQEGKLQNWNERESQFHAKWHSTLDRSNKIMPPTQKTVKIRPEDREMVARATKIYQKLNEYAL